MRETLLRVAGPLSICFWEVHGGSFGVDGFGHPITDIYNIFLCPKAGCMDAPLPPWSPTKAPPLPPVPLTKGLVAATHHSQSESQASSECAAALISFPKVLSSIVPLGNPQLLCTSLLITLFTNDSLEFGMIWAARMRSYLKGRRCARM